MAEFADSTEGTEARPSSRRRNRRAARSLGVLILVAIVAVFVIQNSQRVTVRFWFVTGHAPLIWVIIVCLAWGRRRRLRGGAAEPSATRSPFVGRVTYRAPS
jgi:uncharacterized integral membrane protein